MGMRKILEHDITGPTEQRGGGEVGERASPTPPQNSLLMCPFLLMKPLNVLFEKRNQKCT